MTKKAALFTPYVDTLGGGERYLFTLGQVLLDEGWEVTVSLEDQKFIRQVRERFNLSLPKLKTVSPDFFTAAAVKKLTNHFQFDLLFWVSDGSVPLMLAKKNWLHFQVPFHDLPHNRLVEKIKLMSIDRVVCNSRFTQKIIDAEFGTAGKSVVWYPPVGVEDFAPAENKDDIIVAVGRFSQAMNVKRQDILITAFKKMVDNDLTGWRLVVIGGSQGQSNPYLQKLQKQAAGYPIEFKVNAPFKTLKQTYARAKIFWHAAGYGVDEARQPERVEHFGMTTVEAMASGCFPLVYAAGGQKEILANTQIARRCLWKKPADLIKQTRQVQASDINQDYLIKLAQSYSVANFKKQVQQCL